MVSKLIDGKFPEYKSLIPSKNINVLTIDSEYFGEVISRVSTITTGAIEKLRTIQIKINIEQMHVSAYGNSYTSANETVKFSNKDQHSLSYLGEELITGFNPRYLLEVPLICKTCTQSRLEKSWQSIFSACKGLKTAQ